MILTYKLKHNRNYSRELTLAKKIAEFAIKTKSSSTKDVRHIGLKSTIANQILRKYRRYGIKKASSVKLTIPRPSIRIDYESKTIIIPCINLKIAYQYLPHFDYIKQIEIGEEFAYIMISKSHPVLRPAIRYIGVDCNTTGHVAVASNSETGKIYKIGKSAIHTHKKYQSLRKKLQKQGKFQILKQIKNRESRIIRNLNHHISKKLVDIAISEKCGIRFEKLTGIRKSKKHSKSFRYSLNSWSYYQLQKLTEYKARKQGIEVAYVAPAYTSKTCSKCGSLGDRQGKKFSCPRCGHVDHADVNASFNIGNPISHCVYDPHRIKNMIQLHAERDVCKGSTDTPKWQF